MIGDNEFIVSYVLYISNLNQLNDIKQHIKLDKNEVSCIKWQNLMILMK